MLAIKFRLIERTPDISYEEFKRHTDIIPRSCQPYSRRSNGGRGDSNGALFLLNRQRSLDINGTGSRNIITWRVLPLAATALLIGHVAQGTSTIRWVGSGGIMLPNHAPLIIAEQFGTLESLYPGRIDLGLGRAPGTDQATAYALRRTFAAW